MIERWNRYWFEPAPVINLAVCRIIIVGFQLYILATAYGYFMEPASLPEFIYDPLPALELFIWPFGAEYRPSYEVLAATYWATFGGGIAALIGIFTRPSLWVFALGNIFLQAHIYSYGDFHHPEALLMIALVILALSPAGRVLSVDDWRAGPKEEHKNFWSYLTSAGKEKSVFARWPLVLIQVMVAIAYFDAGMSKVEESGLDWINGYTLQYYLAQDAMRWGSDLGLWLSQQHLLVQVMSCISLLFELTFFLVLLFPPLAFLYIPLGIGFHTGIYLTMKAPFFTFMALYAAFVPWSVVWRKVHQHAKALTYSLTEKTDTLKPAGR